MRKPSALLLLAAPLVLTAPQVHAAQQSEQSTSFWVQSTEFFQHQVERSDALFKNIFESMWTPRLAPVQIMIVEEQEAPLLNEQEQQLACGTAVQQVRERLQDDQMTKRLRASLRSAFELVSLHFMDDGMTACEKLGRTSLQLECNRVMNMEKEIEAFLQQGKSNQAICARLKPMSKDPPPPPLSCKLCKRFIEMIKLAMQQDLQKVEEVRALIGDICDSMSPKSRCHAFLQHYDDIVQWIKHGTDANVVCAQISMCTSAEEAAAVVLASHEEVEGNDDHACFYCETITSVIRYINDKAPDQVDKLKTVLKYVCKITPKDCKCDEMEKNFERIEDWVKKGKDPHEICQNLNICKKNQPATAADMPLAESLAKLVDVSTIQQSGDKNCIYCDYFTTMLQIAMQEDPDKVDVVREYADMICGMLGDANQCHQFVNKMDLVVDDLKKGMHPRDICVALGYCPKKTVDDVHDMLESLTLTLDTSAEDVATAVHMGDDDHACYYCQTIASVVKFVNDKSPDQVDKLKTVLKYVCKITPKDCKCDEMEKNFDRIESMVKKGKDPKEICEAIGICKKGAVTAATSGSRLMDALVKLVTASYDDSATDKDCFYCDYFTTMLQIAVQENPDQMDEIREFADMICGILGDQHRCHVYVDKLDTVLDDLKKGVHPRDICIKLGYCPKKQPEESLATRLHKSINASIDSCFFCDQVTQVVKIALEQNPEQINEIRQIADMVCGMLPESNKCHPFVKRFDQVVDSLRKGEDTHAICQDLSLCPKQQEESIETNDSPKKQEIEEPKKDSKCAYCSGIVTVLEVAMQRKPEDVQEMRAAAGIVCELLPKDDQCHADLKMFDKTIEMLKHGKQPHEICHELKFCNDAMATPLKVADLKFLDETLSPSMCTTCKQNTLLLASVATTDRLGTFTGQMDSICRLIPHEPECKLLLDHRDAIIEGLKEQEGVEGICKRMGSCDNDKNEPEAKSMSVGCLFCEYTGEVLARTGRDQAELRLAKEALQTMCFVLPPRAKCDVLAAKFDELAALVHTGKSPSEACHHLGLCDAAFVGKDVFATALAPPAVEAKSESPVMAIE